MPDPALVAELIKSATGPPPKQQQHDTTPSQDPLPPNESPYFNVAAYVAKSTSGLDLNRTLTPSDFSRRLGTRRREAQRANGQYTQDFGHKIFGSGK
jgi:hypothetical protein